MKNEKLFVDLSDEQAEKVVGGVGFGPGPGAGVNGWGIEGSPAEGGGLCSTGMFGVAQNPHTDQVLVAVPIFGGNPPGPCPD